MSINEAKKDQLENDATSGNEQREVSEAQDSIMTEDSDHEKNKENDEVVSSKTAKIENFAPRARIKVKNFNSMSNKNVPKCQICLQKLGDNIQLYKGHPNDAVEEYVALIDEKLSLFVGDEEDVAQYDLRAVNRITSFSVYCKNGHLCPFDSGLIQMNVEMYISGFVKPVYCDDESEQDGVPSKDIGPVVEWFVSGFDGGIEAVIGLSTALGEYYLMKPTEEYAPFMNSVREKTFLSKTVIECILDDPQAEYEDLLNKFETQPMPDGLPRFTEDLLINNAHFICDQVASFDNSASPEDSLLIHAPCITSLIDLSGVILKGRSRRGTNKQGDNYRQKGLKLNKLKKPSWTRATTTQQVHHMFESFFPEQLANTSNKLHFKRRRCGACEACLEPECGKCSSCKNMPKYGGSGTSKQACVKRRCPNMELADDEDDDCDDEYDNIIKERETDMEIHRKMLSMLKKKSVDVQWVGEPICTEKGKFYEAVMINGEEIEKNDYIFIEPIKSIVPMQVIKVRYMWENKMGIKVLHGTWLWRGNQTILKDTALPRELFMIDECQDVPLIYVQSKANVVVRKFMSDNEEESIMESLRENCMVFFCQKRYDHLTARFEDLLPDANSEGKKNNCPTCVRDSFEKQRRIPQLFEKYEESIDEQQIHYDLVKYLGEEFRVGSAVYLEPNTLKFKYPSSNDKSSRPTMKRSIVDENIYPEYYRKFNDRIRGSNFDTPEPFDIGYISSIYSTSKSKLVASNNLFITVKKLYRPENIQNGESLMKKSNINMLYWSDEECDTRFSTIIGKCYVIYSGNLDEDIENWSTMGPNRFYFSEAYDSKNNELSDPPSHAMNIGKVSKGGKSKSKSKRPGCSSDKAPNFPQISKKLRTLDVFAGCGGLSEGLKQSGVAESSWAVENDEAAAHAYRLNNPNASVFTTDCNTFLEKVMNGEKALSGQVLPRKGEVDLLCGGPPCQGFSGMNRFNSRAYSSFKNSLIVSYISFCDYYKPRFFIMENVRNFVSFKKSEVLKLTLSCLVRMGYQCTFGILQAGSFGIPQTRRRMILLAAAPGEILPDLPNPLHVFSKSACQLSVDVDNVKYCTLKNLHNSAPFRVVTVYDALSDLPKIKSGDNEVIMQYNSEPITHFQRKMRSEMSDDTLLYDHICKDLGPLVEARMRHIPTSTGSDWRDLPNINVRLSDGSFTNKLEYKYNDRKSGKSSTGALRGICSCSESKPCNLNDKQVNTLIPWCLPHTANRHNNWAGLYGRIEWDGFFSTTITNPEPMGKQGRVLHPEQTRVVSVRECARSQGFPDSFRFYGNIQDKHRQIGNAVPPPLAAAIGHEIRKSLSLVETVDTTNESQEGEI